jgi:release factor glutamine methyltransferase
VSPVTSADEVARAAAQRLEAAGVPSPDVDARLLVAHVLGVRPSELVIAKDLTSEQRARIDELIGARADRVPLQHLTGTTTFRHSTLQVGPGAFVPRPETEVVAGWAIDRIREIAVARPDPIVVVDLCTGTGAIARAIADESKDLDLTLHAVEVDENAHAWAARNLAGTGAHLHLADVTDLDALTQVLHDVVGRIDVVVSNPPYIPSAAVPRDPEVREHDPSIALFGGEDGLDVIRAVRVAAEHLLRAGGCLVVEHGDEQGESVQRLVAAAGGWTQVADHRDLSGRDRFTTARWEGR